jgi:hypothetical protein
MRNPENRRQKLKEWFKTRSIPTSEKSYISQLLKGTSSFGEKAAIRLEELLGMPDGFLDSTIGEGVQDPNITDVLQIMTSTDEEGRLRVKLAVSDVLYEYNQKKNHSVLSQLEEFLPVAIVQQMKGIKDPEFVSALKDMMDGFASQDDLQKQK